MLAACVPPPHLQDPLSWAARALVLEFCGPGRNGLAARLLLEYAISSRQFRRVRRHNSRTLASVDIAFREPTWRAGRRRAVWTLVYALLAGVRPGLKRFTVSGTTTFKPIIFH